MPMPEAMASFGLVNVTSRPSRRIRPSSGWYRPYRMFMSVVLPAPFSPSSAWISPSSTTRSTWSLATTPRNRLVIPSSSSFRAPYPRVCSGLVVLGVDRDRSVLDALLDGVDLGLQVGRHLALEVVVRRDSHAAVLQ